MGSSIDARKAVRRLVITVVAGGIIIPPTFLLVKNLYQSSWQTVANQLTPSSISLEMSHIYSDTLSRNITTFVTQQTPDNMLSFIPNAFSREVKKKFPAVGSIEWTFTPSKELHFSITGQEPRYLINEQFVLTDKKKLISAQLFSLFDINKLPCATVSSIWCRDKIARRVYTFLNKIPPSFFQNYVISYHKPSLIKLYPKHSLYPCFIIADEKSFFDEKKYTALSMIFADMYAKKLLNKKIIQAQQPLLAFDLRFEKTIAVKFFDSFKRGTGK